MHGKRGGDPGGVSSELAQAPKDSRPHHEAVVETVGFEVAHDSAGIVVLTLRYPNGARAQLHLEGDGISRVVEQLGLESVHALVGRAFSELAPALPMNAED